GHQAVLIIGNYTALVGDPSGRDQTRARLTQEQVEANAQDYLKQISKVIDRGKAEVRKNGEWFEKFTFLDTLSLTSKITVQRMLGYDSVMIHADVELGGTEQLFNLMVGRDLQREAGQEPQVCVTLPILRGRDGEKRMGKSLGNYVGIGEPAKEQFGKTMSIPDSLLGDWFLLLTDRPAEEVQPLIAENPMEAKKTLAADIVSFYHGAEAARAARTDWENQFSKRQD